MSHLVVTVALAMLSQELGEQELVLVLSQGGNSGTDEAQANNSEEAHRLLLD
jgi:hypothetical protein